MKGIGSKVEVTFVSSPCMLSMNQASGPSPGINWGREMHFLSLCFYSTHCLVVSFPHRVSCPFEQSSGLGARGQMGRKSLGRRNSTCCGSWG